MGSAQDADAALAGVPNAYTDPSSLEVIRQHRDEHRNLGSLAVADAARRDGAEVRWLSGRDVWAVYEDRRLAIAAHCGTESTLSTAIVADKLLAKHLMDAAGVRVPRGRLVTSEADTVAAGEELGRSVVVKPRYGLQSRGVTVNVTAPDDLREAYRRARRQGCDVLVEEFIDGVEYRVHATDRECVGVFRRLLPSITGDGTSTILELVRRKNENRRANPSTARHPVPTDDVAEGFLTRRGLSWESVLPAGEAIVVRDVNGITSGGDSLECFDTVGPELKDTAVRAVAAIPGMDWAGTDILVERGTGTPYVMEINTDAAINGSTFPVFGTPRDLGGTLLRHRRARSVPETTTAPQVLTDWSAGGPLSTGESRVYLHQLLQRHLGARGYEVERRGRRIVTAVDPAQPEVAPLWFSGSATAADLLVSHRYLRRGMLMRQSLRRSGVSRPAARRVRDAEELRRFLADHSSESAGVALIPTEGHLPGGALRTLTATEAAHAEESLLDGATLCAQVHPQGLRLRIVATVEQALAAVGSAQTADALRDTPAETAALHQASEVAVEAVRAVPELRWAVVDVVVTEQAGALVEGMTIRPRFEADDEVFAGSLEEVFTMIIDGARTWTPTRTEEAAGQSAAGRAETSARPAAQQHVDAETVARIVGGRWEQTPPADWWAENLHSMRRVTRLGRRARTGTLTAAKNPGRSLPKLQASGADLSRLVVLVAETAEIPETEAAVLRVPDVEQALQAISIARREAFGGDVVAVTGSVGKTTVSRMTAHVLGSREPTYIGRTTHNDLITARANLFQLSDETHAVFEVSRLGLPGAERILRPQVVIITAIAEAHLEDFGTMEDIARAKAVLLQGLDGTGTAVINADAPHADLFLRTAAEYAGQTVTYGTSASADLRLLSVDAATGEVEVDLGDGERLRYRLSASGEHQALNSLAVVAALRSLGRDPKDYLHALESFAPVRGRGEVHELSLDGRRLTLVDESFNANPTSMRAAISGFAAAHSDRRRILVLGDMQELGEGSGPMHAQLREAVLAAEPAEVHLMGPMMRQLWGVLPEEVQEQGQWSESVEQMRDRLAARLRSGDAVLVKSSHSTGLDALVTHLTRSGTVISQEPAKDAVPEPTAVEAGSPTVSRRVVVSGPAVQGVGYRNWLRDLAQERGLDGWVRNRSDGGVEMLLRGPDDDVLTVITAAHHGPERAEVRRVTSTLVDTVPRQGFRRRATRTISG